MKKSITYEILFICILAVLGWPLYNAMKSIESRNIISKSIEDRLTFLSGSGIDVMGNMIEPVMENEVDISGNGVIAFLLRHSSLDADIKFWNEVSGIITESNIVQLIAYCENVQCVDAIKKEPDKIRFPVLEYGEIIDMQAINAADKNGEYWLIGLGGRSRKIKWRDGVLIPDDIVWSMLQ